MRSKEEVHEDSRFFPEACGEGGGERGRRQQARGGRARGMVWFSRDRDDVSVNDGGAARPQRPWRVVRFSLCPAPHQWFPPVGVIDYM